MCTDAARRVFKHVGAEGEVVKDVKATNLTSKLAGPIKSKAGVIARELVEEYKGDADMFSTVSGLDNGQ